MVKYALAEYEIKGLIGIGERQGVLLLQVDFGKIVAGGARGGQGVRAEVAGSDVCLKLLLACPARDGCRDLG
jgi:hypothetical protein